MIAIIGQFYKTEDKALKRIKELKRLWRNRVAWYIFEAKNGYFVISENQARKIYPNMNFYFTDRRY